MQLETGTPRRCGAGGAGDERRDGGYVVPRVARRLYAVPEVPTLPAYRSGAQLLAWCEHEHVWHYHGAVSAEWGAGDGHRVSHCICARSPLYERGYVLAEVGPFTPAVRRAHGRPLSWARGCRADSCRFDRMVRA